MRFKLLFVLCVAVIMCGCTRTIYLPTETRVETNKNVSDSTTMAKVEKLIDKLQTNVRTQEKVVIRDSVVIMVNEEGSIVSRESFKISDRDYTEKELIERIIQEYDSLFYIQKVQIDSLCNELSKEPILVEKPLNTWEKIKMNMGTIVAFAILILVVFFILKFAKKIL